MNNNPCKFCGDRCFCHGLCIIKMKYMSGKKIRYAVGENRDKEHMANKNIVRG